MRCIPKKRLGQNFLVDRNIQKKIIASCQFTPDDVVLEIGPGEGALTGLICPQVKYLYAVEIDRQLCQALKDKFSHLDNLQIINQDILRYDFNRLSGPGKIRIIGNIPYYITTPIIERIVGFREGISEVFLTVQKEFAERMTASCGSGEYGSFSLFIQYYTQPKIIFTIKKGCFLPVPKVDSSFIRLNIRNKPVVEPKNEEFLFRVIRTAFNQRRKVLRNSLQGVVAESKLGLFFSKYGINPRIRPEELTLEDFLRLADL